MKVQFHRSIITALFLILGLGISRAQEENYEPSTIKTTTTLSDTIPAPVSTSSGDTKQKEKPLDSNKKFDPSKLRIGISQFGFQFGSFYDGLYDYNYFLLQVTSSVGYLFLKDRLELGTGPIFVYEHYKRDNSDYKYSLYTGGFTLYSRGYIWRGLFAQAQYDFVNKTSYYYRDLRVNVSHFLIGAGYSTPIGKAGSFFISALIDVINDDESIYQGTFGDFPLILTIGFGMGIPGGK